jgi:hypothetical protein
VRVQNELVKPLLACAGLEVLTGSARAGRVEASGQQTKPVPLVDFENATLLRSIGWGFLLSAAGAAGWGGGYLNAGVVTPLACIVSQTFDFRAPVLVGIGGQRAKLGHQGSWDRARGMRSPCPSSFGQHRQNAPGPGSARRRGTRFSGKFR